MADGDKVEASIREGMLDRDSTGRSSYFFHDQVKFVATEQCKVLGSQLALKEKEAQITYDKFLSDQFGARPLVDNALAQLIFDSDAPVNLDHLIDDLRLLAGDRTHSKELTRLLDLLYVSNRPTVLREELMIRGGVHYDLYDSAAKGRFAPMATLAKLLADSSARGMGRSYGMALTLSLLATSQEEICSAALLYLAKALACPWDALVLARYYFGAADDTTRAIRAVWEETVLEGRGEGGEDRFDMIRIAISLKSTDPKEVARALLQGDSSLSCSQPPVEPTDLFHSYRCLALALHKSEQLEDEEQRKAEASEVHSLMSSIFTACLGWAKLGWASALMGDVSKRAPLGGIPKEICEIVLRCHLELLDAVLASQGIDDKSPREGSFKQLGVKWRYDMGREHGEIAQLRTGVEESQKEVFDSIDRLVTVLLEPFVDKEKLNTKMECALVAASFLPQLLQWAATSGQEEKLQLAWPERELSFTITNDDSIVLPVPTPTAPPAPAEHTTAEPVTTVAETTVEESQPTTADTTVADDSSPPVSARDEGGMRSKQKRNKGKRRKDKEERYVIPAAADANESSRMNRSEAATKGTEGSVQPQQLQQPVQRSGAQVHSVHDAREQQGLQQMQQARESMQHRQPQSYNGRGARDDRGPQYNQQGREGQWSRGVHPHLPHQPAYHDIRQFPNPTPSSSMPVRDIRLDQSYSSSRGSGGRSSVDFRMNHSLPSASAGYEVPTDHIQKVLEDLMRNPEQAQMGLNFSSIPKNPFEGEKAQERLIGEYRDSRTNPALLLQDVPHLPMMMENMQPYRQRHQSYRGPEGDGLQPKEFHPMQPPMQQRQHSLPLNGRDGGGDRGGQANREGHWERGQPRTPDSRRTFTASGRNEFNGEGRGGRGGGGRGARGKRRGGDRY